jgi:hypothetical protein
MEMRALSELGQYTVLAPHEINKAFYLHQDLQVQSAQLELYQQELSQLLMQSGMPQRWQVTSFNSYYYCDEIEFDVSFFIIIIVAKLTK